MRRVRFLMLTLLVLLAGIAVWKDMHGELGTRPAQASVPPADVIPTDATPTAPSIEAPAPAPVDDGLPPEVADTLALIAAGGPFPHERDGVVFSNFEGHLPARARGWYHEYTVSTPGLDHRGARRIVTGGEPPSEYWYTDDHYESFRRLPSGSGGSR